MDLRSYVALSAARICGEAPQQGTLEIADAALLAPGYPEGSLIFQRMNRRDELGMPSIGSNRVDEAGVSTIRQWIEAMDSCP